MAQTVKRCPIGVVGWGVVGGGVVDVLREDGAEIAARCGILPVVKTIVTKADPALVPPPGVTVSDDIQTICRDPEITTVVHAVRRARPPPFESTAEGGAAATTASSAP